MELQLIKGEEFTQEELQAFENQYKLAMKSLSDLLKEKKAIEKEEKKVKTQIEKAFEDYQIKSLENEYLKITRVEPGQDTVTIDVKAFEKDEHYNEFLKKYPKTVKGRVSYIRISVK